MQLYAWAGKQMPAFPAAPGVPSRPPMTMEANGFQFTSGGQMPSNPVVPGFPCPPASTMEANTVQNGGLMAPIPGQIQTQGAHAQENGVQSTNGTTMQPFHGQFPSQGAHAINMQANGKCHAAISFGLSTQAPAGNIMQQNGAIMFNFPLDPANIASLNQWVANNNYLSNWVTKQGQGNQ